MTHQPKGDLTPDKQILYLVQWFSKFSDFQRSDFLTDHLLPLYGPFLKQTLLSSNNNENNKQQQHSEFNGNSETTIINGSSKQENDQENYDDDDDKELTITNGIRSISIYIKIYFIEFN